ncbi:MAG TPA: response regulator [Candidatus Angelobacter sp.]|nr:response regulator [Candidatus Angelobacter sp.]
MPNILIVEDDPADMRRATAALAELGLGKTVSATSVAEAFRYLDGVREGKHEAPALIVLDLSLGYESGFEILRRWKSDHNLSRIQIVVWTQMGEREQELCRLFGLKHVISKFSDVSELQDAVKNSSGPVSRPAK